MDGMAGLRGRVVKGAPVALLAAGCIALGAGPSAGLASRATCEQASGKTVVANERVRAFTRGERLYVCAARSRRMFVLGDFVSGGCDTSAGCSGVGLPVLAGRYVVYVEARQSRTAGTSAIYMFDTKRVRERLIWREGSLESLESVGISDLIATRLGGIAWIAVRGETGGAGTFRSRVFKANAGANLELLDEGQDIEPGSLGLSESQRRIYWTSSSQPRTAPIR